MSLTLFLAALYAVKATPVVSDSNLRAIIAACVNYFNAGVLNPPGLTAQGRDLCVALFPVIRGQVSVAPAVLVALGLLPASTVTPGATPAPVPPPIAEIVQQAQSQGDFVQVAAGEADNEVDGEITSSISTDGPFAGSATSTVDGTVQADGTDGTPGVVG